YDHGPNVAGGPPGSPDEDGDRYVEFWNLVFPQYDRQPDGELDLLANPGVDTGMGLERITAIMQRVPSNYEIDLFRLLISATGALAEINDARASLANPSVRVISDHIRSSAFLIADGVLPGNETRSYVLRRIIRRALRHGYKLNIREPFFHKLVEPLTREMGEAYPELTEHQGEIVQVLQREEERFAVTLSQGMELLDRTIQELSGAEIPGDVVFQLYDTFGFPTDLTADVARERELTIDMAGFEIAMEAQRNRGRAAAKFSASVGQRIFTDSKVQFSGYERVTGDAIVVGLYADDAQPVESLDSGSTGIVVLDRTPFYAESGGQTGDAGLLAGEDCRFNVTDTQVGGDQHLHLGRVEAGSLAVGTRLQAQVDAERRRKIELNHSATHLMHAALRAELGTHVQQKGSLVAPDRLRFDFSHPEPVTPQQLQRVQAQVNGEIQRNTEVAAEQLSYDEAIARGAMALFGEKYGDQVRVLSMGADYSVELCGGTHVARTGDIGVFRIVSETGIAAGVRRIDAVTGPGALNLIDETEALLEDVEVLVKANRGNLRDKVGTVVADNRRMIKELQQIEQRLAATKGSDLAEQAVLINGINVLCIEVDGEAKSLLQTLDTLKSKLGSAVVVLGHVAEGKVSLIAGVSKDLIERVTAPEIIDLVGPQVGARGGGRPDMARAGGGNDPAALSEALRAVPEWLAARLA
ncbi:MAG: alanine--tRNA ligase, partial [Pseudomonadales bacterium]